MTANAYSDIPGPVFEEILVPATSVADVQARVIDWLWKGRLPIGKLVVLDGEPGVAKSALMTDLAARYTTGRDFPDEFQIRSRRPGGVLIMSAEDAIDDTIRPRLEVAGADLERVHIISTIPTGTFAADGTPLDRLLELPNDIPGIEKVVVEHAVGLVIVDVMVAFLSPELRTNSDQDVRRALAPFAAMAERTRCCIVLIRHLNKKSGESALNRGGGSIGIIGAGRIGLTAGWHPEDRKMKDVNERRRVLAITKANIARYAPTLMYRTVEARTPDGISTVRIDWLGTTAYTADEVVGAGGQQSNERDEIDDWLRDVLRPGPITAKEIHRLGDEESYSKKRLGNARKRVGAQTMQLPGQNPPVWVWHFGDPPSATDRIRGHEQGGQEEV
jgi:hypothetical protein